MKIYPWLRLLWAASAALVLADFVALVPVDAVLLAAQATNLAAYALLTYALYRLADESPRLSRAFLCQLGALVLVVLAFGCDRFAPQDGAGTSALFELLLLCSGAVFYYVSQYQMYWGLDARILSCGYAYPARRLRWCFYLPLLGAFASSLLLTFFAAALPGMLVLFACDAAPLVLLWQYVRAVREREDAPLEQ